MAKRQDNKKAQEENKEKALEMIEQLVKDVKEINDPIDAECVVLALEELNNNLGF